MSILFIILGCLLLIPLAWYLLGWVAMGIFQLLASNAIDYLIVPAILAAGGGGVWLILHGVHAI